RTRPRASRGACGGRARSGAAATAPPISALPDRAPRRSSRCAGAAVADTAAHRGRSESASSSLVLALHYEYKTDPTPAVESKGHRSATLKPTPANISGVDACGRAVCNGYPDVYLRRFLIAEETSEANAMEQP